MSLSYLKNIIFTYIFIVLNNTIIAQVTTYKKIAYRSDIYVNNNWKGVDSALYTYNADTAMTSFLGFVFSANNTWDFDFRYSYTINIWGKKDVQLREIWNGSNWVNQNKYTYTYDAVGNVTSILYEVWNGNNWALTGKIEYDLYNAYGMYGNEYISNYVGGSWVYQSKKSRSYVNNQTLTQSEDRYLWNVADNAWKKWQRYYYTYTLDNIGSVTISYPDTANAWRPLDKQLYTYNLSPLLLTQYLVQKYDTITEVWNNINRKTYTYNAQDLLEKTENAIYSNNTWIPTQQSTYIYNGLQQNIELINEIYNAGNWIKDTRSLFLYNNNLKVEEKKFTASGNNWLDYQKYTYDYDMNSNLIYDKKENYNAGNWINDNQNFYYYQSYVVSHSEFDESTSHIKILPNPTTQDAILTIQCKENDIASIVIYDVSGKVVWYAYSPLYVGSQYLTIPCNQWRSGIYFAKIYSTKNKKAQTVQFVKGQ